ncbi:DUF1512 domain-containing protein [Sulfolobales archaeon SCGC AB-777_J03]|nr:DUF1512 domain-containing protein [Sulfolobales archaeon SCGC AB-777_J03]
MMLFAQADQGGIYSLISTLLFIAFLLILSIPDIQLGFQMWRLSSIVEKELGEIKRMSDNARNKLIDMLKSLNAKDPQGLVDTLAEMFVIDPVSVEPIDIINRMRHLLRGGESKIKLLIKDSVPNADPVTISKLEVSAEVVNALNLVYKVVRHYINLAKKLKSPMLMYQVQMVIPILKRMAEAYSKAQDTFRDGKPVGDSLGPLVAARLMLNATRKWEPAEETVAAETIVEGRKVIVVKALGPLATVGRPGEAVARIVEEHNGQIARIITVDAALKLEGEQTGSVAEGVGVAMGDPGPEKIAIERVATKYGIPIDAVIVKMGMEEAITDMPKEVYDAAEKAESLVRKIITERTPIGSSVIVVGVGNTSGVGQ